MESKTELMLSGIITSLVGVVKTLNAIYAEQKTIQSTLQTYIDQSTTQTNTLLDIQNKVTLLQDQMDSTVSDIQTMATHTGQIASGIADIAMLINTQNTETKQEILDALTVIDYGTVIEQLIDGLSNMQKTFEVETQHLKQTNQLVHTLVESNETMSSRVASIDIRTTALFNNENLEDESLMNMEDQLKELTSLITNSPKQEFS